MYEEAVAIYRSLAQQDPARYRPSLAWALCELGASPKNYGFPAGADTKAMDEGLSLYRTLALADPAAYRPLLAEALARYGSQYRPNHSTMLDISPRIALEEEGLHLFQELAASDPQTYAPKVADASYRLALTTSTRALYMPREDRSDESAAVTLFARSRDLYVELAAGQPQLYKQRLANVQYELGDQLGKLDRYEEALPALMASAEIMRELVSTRIGFKRLSSDFMDILARTATVARRVGNIELAKSLMLERSVVEGRQRWVY